MTVFFSVLFLGILGIMEVLGCAAFFAHRYHRARRLAQQLALEEAQRAKQEKERNESAWLQALARENLPRCTFCINAGLGDAAIGHAVTDADGQVTCPVLAERLSNMKRRAAPSALRTTPMDSSGLARERISAEEVQELYHFYDPYPPSRGT